MKKSTSKPVPAPAKKSDSAKKSVDFETIRKLTDVMQEAGLVEIKLEDASIKIHLRKAEAVSQYVTHAPAIHAPSAQAAPVATSPSSPASTAPVASSSKSQIVKSPFVGTFYRSSAPNKPSFVEVGKVVENGDALCIIEAMKLMNEIESDMRCKILRIFPENASPVEYGEALFEVEPLA